MTLAYYRLEKTSEGSASLAPGDGGTLTGPSEVGTGKLKEDQQSPLSAVIDLINERFGTDFGPEDKLFMDQVVGDLSHDETLAAQARSNPLDNFKHAFDPAAMSAVVNRMERNESIATEFMSNPEFRSVVMDAMMREFWQKARSSTDQPPT